MNYARLKKSWGRWHKITLAKLDPPRVRTACGRLYAMHKVETIYAMPSTFTWCVRCVKAVTDDATRNLGNSGAQGQR